ncbi:4Fe-4S binding protein [Clostridium sp. 'deep sea']|uniref:4Fe-4S binding protein n=1 Tax=Clostridium sp. 'deep sea' TaxID=2779445 RepID=UPI0018968166|nr:4Fe-4S binding protein [Clostridium sp. 'deep sea']QOR36749.1 4Fe-4S binding protein [Clostridium sp. 'deep sea']
MDRPKVRKWTEPKTIKDYPLGSTCKGDHLTSINAGWRTFKPVIDFSKCVNCLRCFLVCPDGAIDKSGEKLEIDYDYCKGCGVCAYECKLKAIDMVREEK